MLQLEKDGLYDLIITGNKLQECTKPPIVFSSASKLFNIANLILQSLGMLVYQLVNFISYGVSQMILSSFVTLANADLAKKPVQALPKKINQNEWRIRNSHCFYFGIYSFNMSKWEELDSNRLNTWCNKTDGSESKKYLVGYLKHTNLLMLVVEDEKEVSQCGMIEEKLKDRPKNWESRVFPEKELIKTILPTKSTNNSNETEIRTPDYSINRYRADPLSYGNRKDYCHNYFTNESAIFECSENTASHFLLSNFIFLFLNKFRYTFVLIYSLILVNHF